MLDYIRVVFEILYELIAQAQINLMLFVNAHLLDNRNKNAFI